MQTNYKQNYMLYLLLAPGFLYVVIFNMLPLLGYIIAFKEFDMFAFPGNIIKSLINSPWSALNHFKGLAGQKAFVNAIGNTLLISVYKIIFSFPLSILFALLLNELKSFKLRNIVLLTVFLPHFLSWAVISGIFISLLSSKGLVNSFLEMVGFEPISFLTDKNTFRSVIVISDIWKELGFNTMVYLAAINSIDKERYEAALIDGAGIYGKMRYITVPGILPLVILMLVIRVGGIMDAGFSQILVMYNPSVYEVSDIIGTYVFRSCLGKLEFSTGTAIGLFNAAIAFWLMLLCNYTAKILTGKSIW